MKVSLRAEGDEAEKGGRSEMMKRELSGYLLAEGSESCNAGALQAADQYTDGLLAW